MPRSFRLLHRCALIAQLAVSAALSTPLTAQSATSRAGSEQAVMAVVRRLFDGMRAGDSSMVRSVFDARVRLVTVTERNGKVITSVETSADNFAKAVGTPHADVWDERIRNERVAIDGPLASVWVEYGFFRGTTFSHCGVDHFLLTRDDAGSWKIFELADTRRTTGCEGWTR
ncbi:MAG: nuclear transport factor 2 family protein [Gemmatimonas sp.]|jgi:hypothetical protein|uniref:nuclear transport factor 2 family protein n=1 Tax=Gemmatimonas sp. TaxID=1962908 RepID=UPI00391F2D3A|nr:nuclear transport factor 2 family protein [Gemmatimonadota bacterium]